MRLREINIVLKSLLPRLEGGRLKQGFDPHNYLRCYTPKKGDILIDVGAWLGLFTLRCSKAVGSSGRVISFEPHPTNFKLLKLNVRLHRLRNVIPLKLALGNFDGTAELHLTHISGESFLDDLGFERGASSAVVSTSSVMVRKLDDIVDRFGLDKVDFIKVDVEGGALGVLEGAERTLLTNPNLSLAIATYHSLKENSDVRSYLRRLRYKLKESDEKIVYAWRQS